MDGAADPGHATPDDGPAPGRAAPEAPPRASVELAQVVPRGAAMDLIVAKATELGVACIVPLEAEHSVRRTSAPGSARWRRIIAEAAEQCGVGVFCPTSSRRARSMISSVAIRRIEPLLVCNQAGEAIPLALACRNLSAPPSTDGRSSGGKAD